MKNGKRERIFNECVKVWLFLLKNEKSQGKRSN